MSGDAEILFKLTGLGDELLHTLDHAVAIFFDQRTILILGDYVLGGVQVAPNGTQITALMPVLSPGTYRLTIARIGDSMTSGRTVWVDVTVGAVGPRGPRGDIGPQGPQGEIGPAGPQGLSDRRFDETNERSKRRGIFPRRFRSCRALRNDR